MRPLVKLPRFKSQADVYLVQKWSLEMAQAPPDPSPSIGQNVWTHHGCWALTASQVPTDPGTSPKQERHTILTETITSDKNKNPGILDFFLSVELRKRKRKRNSGILFFFRKCGLLLGHVRDQQGHYESKCERKSGGISFLSEEKTNKHKEF